MISTILLVCLAVAVVALVGVVFLKFSAAARAGDRTAEFKESAPAFDVALSCKVNGHTYGPFDTGWRCAICGNHVSRREGELYGLVEEGRVERRREAR